ncbi:hypothetical protein ZWY2020_042423 [Hordeum vulgare]|nr:hypothetical protein ZWY2020_042423 [Hordeum vulgare]
MSELIRNRVKKKRRRRSGGGGQRSGAADDLPELNYLKLVLKETLRLYPPATLLLPRETLQHVKIGVYDVSAGTRVTVNAWALGRDPASWGKDVEEFNPDRFKVDLRGALMVPLLAAKSAGLAMALVNVEFALANLLCGFDWALPEGIKAEDLSMEEAGGLTFHRKTPLILMPTPYVPPSAAA